MNGEPIMKGMDNSIRAAESSIKESIKYFENEFQSEYRYIWENGILKMDPDTPKFNPSPPNGPPDKNKG